MPCAARWRGCSPHTPQGDLQIKHAGEALLQMLPMAIDGFQSLGLLDLKRHAVGEAMLRHASVYLEGCVFKLTTDPA